MPVIILSRSGMFIPFSAFSGELTLNDSLKNANAIHRYFLLKYRLITGHFKQKQMSILDKKNARIICPRFGIFQILMDKEKRRKYNLRHLKINNRIKNGKKINLTWTGKLKENQKLIASNILSTSYSDKYASVGRSGLILKLAAGQGKTYIALYLISQIKQKTLVVCHNKSILHQWKKIITVMYPNIIIGYYYGGCKTDGDIVLAVINSLTRKTFTNTISKKPKVEKTMGPLEYFSQFGFMIFDECHEYCGPKTSNTFKIMQARYMLGLSATPDIRVDKFDRLTHNYIGPILDAELIPGYNKNNKVFLGNVKKISYYGPPEHTETVISVLGMTSVPETLNNILNDDKRLIIICNEIIKVFKKNHNIFVFADRKKYLDKIHARLIVQGAMSDIVTDDKTMTKITGGASEEKINLAELHAKIILTTYQFMGTGKSIPKMDAIILVTPRKTKSEQYIKRIFRLSGDNSITRQIIDIVDMNTALRSQWSHRKRYYKKQGFPITDVEINSDNNIPIEIVKMNRSIKIDNKSYTSHNYKNLSLASILDKFNKVMDKVI